MFWSEAVITVDYLINGSPTSLLKDKVPAEIWYEQRPNLEKLKVFGCAPYLHLSKNINRGKFDSQ